MEYLLLVSPGQDLPSGSIPFRHCVLPWEYGDISRSHWLGESWKTGRFLNSLDVDLYHAPDLYIPRGLDKPVIVTVCDYFELPLMGRIPLFDQTYGWRWNFRFRFRYRWTWHALDRRATSVATISNTTAVRVRERFPNLARRVTAIPLGLDDTWFGAQAEMPNILAKFGLTRPLILHVGGLEQRKNPKGVLETFSRLHDEIPSATLALAGPLHGPKQESPGVRVLGFLPLDELRALYRSADCLLFPSFDEGFGLPVVEALSQGCAVVTSRGTATEEVAMGHATLVDPRDHDAILAAVRAVIRSPRPQPVKKMNRASDMARSYFSLYKQCLGETDSP